MLDQISKSIGIPTRYRKNSDSFATNLVNLVARSFKRNLLDGFSVSEKVEYIFERYPHMQKKDEKKRLNFWFWMSTLLLIFSFLISDCEILVIMDYS